ncbi:hypothetical protein [uncultured Bifidobacterium sp.]|uniref:hypothetical protein n=1 Tax=uncultured Bifidobacterium sp. TaxID=165187 RepID=UPI002615F604|nr:hypothetical protein [uncultured Bifidobacterium sp.]
MASLRGATSGPDRSSTFQRIRDRLRRLGLTLTLVIATSMVLVIVWFTVSPTPSILLLRNAFREQELTTPTGYEAMRKKVTVVRNLTYPSGPTAKTPSTCMSPWDGSPRPFLSSSGRMEGDSSPATNQG